MCRGAVIHHSVGIVASGCPRFDCANANAPPRVVPSTTQRTAGKIPTALFA
jgi:hypothetical protein